MRNFLIKIFIGACVGLLVTNVVSAGILFQNELFEVEGDKLVLDSNSEATSTISLQFGETIGESLNWDISSSSFILSDDLSVEGGLSVTNNIDLNLNQLVEAKLENLASAPSCNAGSIGRIFYNTGDDSTYSCNGSTWSVINGGGTGNTLDLAYDEGGAGSGSLINADSGAVTIAGDGLSVDNLLINDNNLSSLNVNGNISISPNGEGIIDLNSDLNISGNTITLNDDNSGGNVSLSFGQTLLESLTWDSSNSRFTLSDDLRIDGNSAVVGTEYIAVDHSVSDSDGTLALGLNSSGWETFMWDDSASAFLLSDSLTVINDITVQDNLDVEDNAIIGSSFSDTFTLNSGVNSNVLPSSNSNYDIGSSSYFWNSVYSDNLITGNTVGDNVNFGQNGMIINLTNHQSTYLNGRSYTIEIGDLLRSDPSYSNSAEVTISEDDYAIGVALNNSNNGQVASVLIYGKVSAKCSGTINRGTRVEGSMTSGYVVASGGRTVGVALSTCSNNRVDVLLHL